MGVRRDVFRKAIEDDLIRFGYRPGSWIWQTNPARLVVSVAGTFRDLPIKGTMGKAKLAFELGRLRGWAEMLHLTDTDALRPTRSGKRGQLDLEDYIAGAAA